MLVLFIIITILVMVALIGVFINTLNSYHRLELYVELLVLSSYLTEEESGSFCRLRETYIDRFKGDNIKADKLLYKAMLDYLIKEERYVPRYN